MVPFCVTAVGTAVSFAVAAADGTWMNLFLKGGYGISKSLVEGGVCLYQMVGETGCRLFPHARKLLQKPDQFLKTCHRPKPPRPKL